MDPGADAAIRALLERGDVDAACTAAVNRLGNEILGYIRAILRDEDDAGDAFSLFAETVWSSLAGFRWEASLRTWAYRVAWTSAQRVRDDAFRRRGRRLMTSEASRLAEEIRSQSALRREVQADRLATLRASLTPEEQTLLVLRIDKELSWDEIATVLSTDGAPVQAAALRKRFERLKERLGRMAREAGLID
jgi:RNA polymerase sigma-70 factor (ECF subfamily)